MISQTNRSIGTVLERNQKIEHYDGCIREWDKLDQANRKLSEHAEECSKERLNVSTVNFPAVNNFMEGMYMAALKNVMWQMYQAQRALKFASLNQVDIIAESLGKNPVGAQPCNACWRSWPDCPGIRKYP